MTKKLSWRLSKLPTVSEVKELLDAKIITQEEAKEILFKDEEDVDVKALKEEIKFLKKLSERLADSPSKIVETIRYIEKPYYNHGWYNTYATWCDTSGGITPLAGDTITAVGGVETTLTATSATNFSNI